ncbi:MAG: peptidyl-prolyl cis-trans isomerase, partial [Nitrospirae bacterium]
MVRPLLCLLALLTLPAPARAANPVVELTTTAGTIAVELYPDKAPKTVENFLAYVDSGFYDG